MGCGVRRVGNGLISSIGSARISNHRLLDIRDVVVVGTESSGFSGELVVEKLSCRLFVIG